MSSLPTYFGTAGAASGTANITPTWPTGHQTDDVGLLFVESANEVVAAPVGWTEAGSSPQGVGTAGVAGSVRVHCFWKRATSNAETSPTVVDPGDHARGIILVFRGCENTATPVHVTNGNTLATAATAVSIPGGTSTIANCLVVACVANATDAAANQTTATSFANPDLANVTRRTTGNTSLGVGGGLDIATGEKAVAGAFQATTTTLVTASAQARLMVGLIPPASGPVLVTEGGFVVATGTRATPGVVSATTATLDTTSVQAMLTIALKSATPPANLPPVVAAIGDKSASVGTLLSFNLSITDPEGAALTVTLQAGTTAIPAGAVVNSNVDGTFDFGWTPTSDQAGQWNLIVRAFDGVNTTDQSFNITVSAGAATTLLSVAQGIAARAQADALAGQALATLVLSQEQLNAQVANETRKLMTDLNDSQTYMTSVLALLAANQGSTG